MQDVQHKNPGQRRQIWTIYGIIGILLSMLAEPLHAGLFYDNRFFPLTLYPYVSYYDRDRYATLGPFMTTTPASYEREERDVPLFNILGSFDQKAIALAMAQAGYENPFVAVGQEDLLLTRSSIIWNMNGKIQSQGLFFGAQYGCSRHVTLGFEWYFMRANSRLIFSPEESRDRIAELEVILRTMTAQLGMNGTQSDEVGMGDLDLYLRVGNNWDYTLKFRHIDLGMRFGLLVPAGKRASICDPASVPFGGNGHWGFYLMGDGEFELKEDWKLGLFIGLSKRLAKTQLSRMPISDEPINFGVAVGDARVNPGPTFMFAPYFSVENLREGFGARLQYTLSIHGEDGWTDKRCNKTVPVRLRRAVEFSRWSGGHVTLTALYDFGKMKVKRVAEPIVYLAWDVPVNVIMTHMIPKTTKVSIGIEFNF